MKLFYFLKLLRFDIATGTFFLYLTGVLKAKGIIGFNDFIVAFLVSFVSFNFIYSYNSYADYKIDAINKPYRPIPSGKIKPVEAFYYSMFLFALSFIYPFFVANNYLSFFIFLSFPVLGFFYSNKSIILRKIPFFTSLITSTGIFLALYSGFINYQNNISFIPDFFIIWILLSITIIFKDFEDIKGDKTFNLINMHDFFSFNFLTILFFAGFCLNLFLLFYFEFKLSNFYILFFTNLICGIIILFSFFKKKFRNRTYCFLTRILVVSIIFYFMSVG
ncbi:MAG: UbiA family prenyltransferase, partial [Candidatus Muiribacteriota bacterium]